MPRIRVLVGAAPRMLTDIITSLLSAQDDMQMVGVVESGASLLEALGRTSPDVVIVGVDDSATGWIGEQLLIRRPDLKVIGVSADGRTSILYERRPLQVPLGDLSPQALLEAIRTGRGPAEGAGRSSGTLRGHDRTR